MTIRNTPYILGLINEIIFGRKTDVYDFSNQKVRERLIAKGWIKGVDYEVDEIVTSQKGRRRDLSHYEYRRINL